MRVSRSLISPSYWWGLAASESRGRQRETFVALNDGETDEVPAVLAVEPAGADDECRTFGDLARELPSVESRLRAPEIERAFGHWGVYAEVAQRLGHHDEARPVTLALDVHVLVVVVGDRDGGLHRRGHHEAGVLTDQLQETHQLLITGVEAGAHPGEVGPLGTRVHGEHAVTAKLQDRPRWAGPGVLGVALVTRDRYVVFATP